MQWFHIYKWWNTDYLQDLLCVTSQPAFVEMKWGLQKTWTAYIFPGDRVKMEDQAKWSGGFYHSFSRFLLSLMIILLLLCTQIKVFLSIYIWNGTTISANNKITASLHLSHVNNVQSFFPVLHNPVNITSINSNMFRYWKTSVSCLYILQSCTQLVLYSSVGYIHLVYEYASSLTTVS